MTEIFNDFLSCFLKEVAWVGKSEEQLKESVSICFCDGVNTISKVFSTDHQDQTIFLACLRAGRVT